ncbi:hypothetical protein JRC04_16190 [Mycolicibacterium sp. S2-37]|uniref:hypothetical protein n=1 Tax=Mycolicibacterium sp. S2-37 TaxID=2810297 RepID=UPI001A94E449|nr:hypothetical protein [Mycolicibacterium sp. S2-37]MBO0679008.1 hypothetical protein [Mycolicibacterium sp. S2-37]
MAARVFGFSLSVLVLAAASLAAIPAMIAASGEAAWGAIALGQVIGTVAGVGVSYGWGWLGPARIARSSPTTRRSEYLESIFTRAVLVVPISVTAALAAIVLASSFPLYAAAGAVYSASMGLSASWYFVGVSRPFAMFSLDTLPRALGTAGGVALMYSGSSAIAGPIGMFCGMILGLALSTIWILREATAAGAARHERRPLRTILSLNRHGIASAMGSAAYYAAPLAIVSLVAPVVQPTFALADRVKQQLFVATTPFVTVLQGWVPRGSDSSRLRRSKLALSFAAAFAVLLGLAATAFTPMLINWLGNDQIRVSFPIALLVSACVSVSFFQSVLERAALATFDKLRIAARAVTAGSLVGLPLVAVGALQFGTVGALGGVITGLLTCVTIEFICYCLVIRDARLGRPDNTGPDGSQPTA